MGEEVTGHSKQILLKGIAKEDKICAKALDMFVNIYGSIVGDFCLSLHPTGGFYLLGGVTLGIKEYLMKEESGFLKAI